MWLSIKTIRSRVHVPCSDSTIRRYADLKLIRSKRANNKSKRYYHLNDIQETFQAEVTPDVPENNPRAIVAYCRVSSRKQNSDLVRQVNHIEASYSNIKIYKDIASGLNFNRSGFRKLTEDICRNKVRILIVTDRDRLLRFAYSLYEQICNLHQCEIRVLNEESSPEEKLQNDLMSVVNVYVAQHNGLRSARNRRNRESTAARTELKL